MSAATTPPADLPGGDAVVAQAWRPRSDAHRAAHQVAGIDAFNHARRQAEWAEQAATRSREMRMDTARRLEVLRRQHAAVVEQAHEGLRRSVDVLLGHDHRTAVLAHRNAWFLDRVQQVLAERGVEVIVRTDNGADAVGCAVAEQPDLLLVEDTLAMLPGDQVVRDVLRWCPSTRVVAQVAYADRVGALLDAGAAAVYTRRVPPLDVATAMHEMVSA